MVRVLVHYTTQEAVYKSFNYVSKEIVYPERVREVKAFYEQYSRSQENLFFVISYYNESASKSDYCVGKVTSLDDKFYFKKVSDEISNILLEGLSFDKRNSYERDFYYKTFAIEDTFAFRNKILSTYINKIKLRHFDWDELINSNEVLFEKISEILFSKDNVLRLATTYNPDFNYNAEMLEKKYYSALEKIGFINQNGINASITDTILHGDIGEFLMHALVGEFLESDNRRYLYPKLIFKTNAKMPVYGNDGTIYVPDANEIYYLEAKFYKKLEQAINKAVESLNNHNSETSEDISHNVELFRNIMTNRQHEIIEINDNVEEKLIIFAMCADKYTELDIKNMILSNNNIKLLGVDFEVHIFVLPVLNKLNFLNFFKLHSKKVGAGYYE